MKQNHDWLLGEDSALRPFLPPTITARSPRAVAGASAALTVEPEAPAPIPGETHDAE